MIETNPFAEFTPTPQAEYRVDFTCKNCKQQDHVLGYNQGTTAMFSINPPPTVRCTCGVWNRLVLATPSA